MVQASTDQTSRWVQSGNTLHQGAVCQACCKALAIAPFPVTTLDCTNTIRWQKQQVYLAHAYIWQQQTLIATPCFAPTVAMQLDFHLLMDSMRLHVLVARMSCNADSVQSTSIFALGTVALHLKNVGGG